MGFSFLLISIFVDIFFVDTIDITTTSTLRPQIIQRTYESFFHNIFSSIKDRYKLRLIINIDPIGEKGVSQIDIMEVARCFFSEIISNFPLENNFSTAVKWVWSHTSSAYVFNLEDMWRCHCSIDLNDLIYILDNYKNIVSVNLHKHILADGAKEPWFYSSYLNKNDKRLFLQMEKPLLSPGLWRGDFVRKISRLMNDIDFPELQIWGDSYEPGDKKASSELISCLEQYDYAIYCGNWNLPFWYYGKPAVYMFEGRKWKKKYGFYKKDPFSKWEKI